MNIRTLIVVSLTAFAFLSCQDPEITSPNDTNVDDFALPEGAIPSGTVIVPYMPQRSNNIVYLSEEHFVVQVIIYNVPPQTSRGWFEVEVPPCMKIDTVKANPKYFDSTGMHSIFVKLIDSLRQNAQYAVSYTRDNTVKTRSSGVLCNLVCKPAGKGGGKIKFPTSPVFEELVGSNIVGAKGASFRPIALTLDSLDVEVKDGLD